MIRKFVFTAGLMLFSLLPFSCENFEELGLSNEEVVAGLKEALRQGASYAADTILSKTDGYFKDEAVKILLPQEAQSLIKKAGLEGILNTYIQEVVSKMNHGAELAATKAFPIFANSITSMTVNDGMNILKGNDTAATAYLRISTSSPMKTTFKPIIDSCLKVVGADVVWNSLFSNYNNLIEDMPLKEVLGIYSINPNLGEYATQKALDGLFLKVGVEETAIRNDVKKRRSELLQKVFQEQD